MTRWRLVVLILELTLFAIILILPQVDLPDFTFPSGTAPVAVHSSLYSSPLCIGVMVAPLVLLPRQMTEALRETLTISASSQLDSRLSRLCVLIC